MATVQASPRVDEFSQEFESLRHNSCVEAVLSNWADDTYVVWIGIVNDDDGARRAAYQLEDQVAEKFPRVLFDFHVIALPEGGRTQDYVSNAQGSFI
ncbi:MAG TPA: hypothetical protein VJQ59_15560 [Candidatus Sulfotelmatobacter sp.]|nr:hypothetical protein [Candidatus Sulfotelmatobacter sp.]